MSTAGISGANNQMTALMQILMQGMQQQMDMTKQMMAVSVQNSAAFDKMAIAQQIIDVYA